MGLIRSPWLWVTALILIAGLGGVQSWRMREERWFRAELAQAEDDLKAGRIASARDRLLALTMRRPSDGEAWYRLGLCEESRHRLGDALKAWEHVPSGSTFAVKAAVARGRILIDSGRFSEAETLLDAQPRKAGDDAEHVRGLRELLYRYQGRTDDLRREILGGWGVTPDPGLILRRYYGVDISIYPIELVGEIFASAPPDDDRIWLSRAHLAREQGQLDEAARLLKDCQKKRPDDDAVWREALAVAQARGDVAEAWEAMKNLPAAIFSPAEQARLRVWFASKLHDPQAERLALESLVTRQPGDTVAWDRLAELALARGDATTAQDFRKRKAEINAIRARYKMMIDRQDRTAVAGELAQLAVALGRNVEAKGWRIIANGAVRQEPLIAEDGSTITLAEALAEFKPREVPTPKNQATTDTAIVPEFTDDAERAGLTFVYDNGHRARRPPPPEAMGGGVGLLDFDGDGWLDVYVVQGGSFPPSRPPSTNADRLYRNKRDGTFEDVSARSGIAGFAGGYGHGVTVGDYDNDGKPDLFITRWRGYALYRNKGDGTFDDVTERVGLQGDRDWPTSAAFADLDGDGDLDLYVCHYLKYEEIHPKPCRSADDPSRHECNPLDFDALPDHAFRNDGGKFVDVTKEAGLFESAGRGLGVVATDLDGDNRVDLYVANDLSANYLFKNLGEFRFEEVGILTGAATSAEGGYKAGMGVACGDFDADGLVDLAVTNYLNESTTYYRNFGQGLFVDHSDAIGISAPTRLLLGFGIAFLDADNDGRLDVLSANGHVVDHRPKFPWMMPLQLLTGDANGRLRDVSSRAGPPFRSLHLGRGLATGDLDNDGRLDALVICQNEPLVYLHNQTSNQKDRHYLVLKLEGTKSNRDGIGASVTVQAGKGRWVVPRFGGGSYQSAGDLRLHIGLGTETKVDRVEVKWPSGHLDVHRDLKADSTFVLREGDAQVSPLR